MLTARMNETDQKPTHCAGTRAQTILESSLDLQPKISYSDEIVLRRTKVRLMSRITQGHGKARLRSRWMMAQSSLDESVKDEEKEIKGEVSKQKQIGKLIVSVEP